MSIKYSPSEREMLTKIAVDFLKGKTTDRHGRKITDFMNLSEREMEDDHEWIQWVFPINTPSPHNPFAGQIFDGASGYFRQGSKLADQQFNFLNKYSDSIGLGWRNGKPDPQKFFSVINDPYNHHVKRISRVLKHLMLTGKHYTAKHWFSWLLQMIGYNPNVISGYTVALWAAIVYDNETYLNYHQTP